MPNIEFFGGSESSKVRHYAEYVKHTKAIQQLLVIKTIEILFYAFLWRVHTPDSSLDTSFSHFLGKYIFSLRSKHHACTAFFTSSLHRIEDKDYSHIVLKIFYTFRKMFRKIKTE